MGMNAVPAAERIHIGFFGRRNAGKSSLVNAVTGQQLAIVSDVRGTTTDPVYKTMELLPMGPVVIIDTPGIDDEGELGALRVQKSRQALHKTDVAVLVADAALGLMPEDKQLIEAFRQKGLAYVVVFNKSDLASPKIPDGALLASAVTGEGVRELKERIAHLAVRPEPSGRIVADLLAPGDLAVMVVPIDKAAPKGRLILPQQQTLRDILDAGAFAVVARETELVKALAALGQRPRLVITDSQVFKQVAADIPADLPLTSFSILFARYKGNLDTAIKGAAAVDSLQDGDKVLIAEGCTHHRQCDDIGSVKIPRWIAAHTKKSPEFCFCSGTEFPDDLSPYKLIIHCGGCMLSEREMKYRLACAADQGIPITNYGILIAHLHGILARSIAPLGYGSTGEREYVAF
ncbi:MAG: [FeFe] hydrogenase H-cluster maturation GTPase HydF [Oscillospiraceae bacterium]|jgi:[FeFe] hydrogenase H-cluster maturation GTPase HydF|nr:[FeFe] hydrogenase H-cluster maturation GTPase HydF [Oscillospiraceae bacterium]